MKSILHFSENWRIRLSESTAVGGAGATYFSVDSVSIYAYDSRTQYIANFQPKISNPWTLLQEFFKLYLQRRVHKVAQLSA